MITYAFPLTDEQRAVIAAREWRKWRLVNSEQITNTRAPLLGGAGTPSPTGPKPASGITLYSRAA